MYHADGPQAPFYAQDGEDRWCLRFFRRYGAESQVAVDIGAHNGLYKSNTAYFRLVLGWQAWLFDIHPRAPEVVEARVDAENINDLWRLHRIPQAVDLFSLDIDGNDLWVWKALTASKPRVVIVEYNPKWKPWRHRTIAYDPHRAEWDRSDYYGASAGALVALGHEKGYDLARATRSNLIFVVKGLLEKPFPIGEIQQHHKDGRRDPLRRKWVGYP